MDVVIISHFVTEFCKDGTSRFVYIAEHLSQNHEVELITSRFDHIKKQQRTQENFDLQTKITMLDELSYPKNVCLKRFLSHAYFGKQVKKYLNNRKKPDILYCAVPSLDCAYYAARYAQKNGIKFIVDVQDVWPEAFKMVFRTPVISDLVFAPMKRKADFIYSCADQIVGVSETFCKRAKKVNRKNAQCIPVFLGTKLVAFDEHVKKNRITRKDGKFIIGYCGTLGHSYDIKCVLDALAILKEKKHGDISFWVMGDGPLKEHFEEYARQYGVDTTFYGRVPYSQMCGLLASCDACINPISQRAASIINKHGDYAASGLPVINTQSSEEYRELIETYCCGINCASGDADAVANAIIYLVNHPTERKRMGGQSRKMAERLFNREKSYQQIYALFGKGDTE